MILIKEISETRASWARGPGSIEIAGAWNIWALQHVGSLPSALWKEHLRLGFLICVCVLIVLLEFE